jgi:hypothetical protein
VKVLAALWLCGCLAACSLPEPPPKKHTDVTVQTTGSAEPVVYRDVEYCGTTFFGGIHIDTRDGSDVFIPWEKVVRFEEREYEAKGETR